jgi:glucuronosyltransferase
MSFAVSCHSLLTLIVRSFYTEHNNVRAFVTHGGLMGTQEAVYYGVPMIGVPVYADQAQNIDLYVQKKTAVVLELSELTEEHLDAALNAVLHDPSYM